MPNATITVRELKNKDTGVDVSIPTFQEIPGLIGVTVEFQVVVVTRLRQFKLPKHKDEDVVQFMIKKKQNDFEELHSKLGKRYPATVLPPLPRKTLFSDLTYQELRAGYEQFLQFLCVMQKLCSCSLLNEFLGVKGEHPEEYSHGNDRSPGSSEDIEDIFEESQARRGTLKDNQQKTKPEKKKPNIFNDEKDDDVDLFTSKPQMNNDDELDLLALAKAADERAGITPKGKEEMQEEAQPARTASSETRLFDDQDYGGGIEQAEADKLFYIPRDESAEKPSSPLFGVEDNSELLNVEEDIDKFLAVELSKRLRPKEPVAKKPAVSAKPQIASKPKIAPKPSNKPVPGPKPGKPPLKPKPGAKPVVSPSDVSEDLFSNTKKSESFGTDDILKYIQENADDTEVDLFS